MAGPCRAGDVLGVVNGDFAVVGSSQVAVAFDVLERLDLATAELVTMVVGRDGSVADCEEISKLVAKVSPHVDFEILQGGQDTYPLFLAVE